MTMNTENEIRYEEIPLLSEEDARLDFELRRAAIDDTAVPDTDAAFERFKTERIGQERQKTRRIPMWTIAATVAACLLLVAIFTWQKSFFSSSQEDELLQAQTTGAQSERTDTVYKAPAPMNEIALAVGKQSMALNSDMAKKSGVSIDKDEMIRFLTPENVRPEDRTTLTIPQGKTAKIMLPDGSKVWLNACSRLIFPQAFLKDAPREVRLIGEAYFEVVHDERRPFIVYSETVSTKVLGTQFNIRSFNNEKPCVTLVSGSVKCEAKGTNPVILKPGQQVVVTPNGSGFSVSDADLEGVLSWKNGEFYFEDQTLRDVLTEIGRWYNVNVVFSSEEHLGDPLHYTGDRSWSIKQVIEQLNHICETKIHLENNNLIVE